MRNDLSFGLSGINGAEMVSFLRDFKECMKSNALAECLPPGLMAKILLEQQEAARK